MTTINLDSTKTVAKLPNSSRSCNCADVHFDTRADFVLDGVHYDRAISERVYWRNYKKCKHIRFFVQINGTLYAVSDDDFLAADYENICKEA